MLATAGASSRPAAVPARADALTSLSGTVEIHPLDVTDFNAVDGLAAALSDVAIDLLILNAGISRQHHVALEHIDYDLWMEELKVNAVAPIKVAAAFAGHIARSAHKRIVSISSGAGSIANVKTGGHHPYRSSKSGLNAAMRCLALDLADRGIIAVPIAPGHTKTDMGGAGAPQELDDTVTRIRRTIASLTLEDSGRFLSRDGEVLPW